MTNKLEIKETLYKAPKIELKYISDSSSARIRSKISNSEEAYNLMLELFNKETIAIYEELHIAFLNKANIVIGTYMVSKGGTSGTVMDVKLVVSIALKTLATGVIIAHNHPSGALKPSTEDVLITKRLEESLKLFDIKVIDHLIVSPEGGYFSFADLGDL